MSDYLVYMNITVPYKSGIGRRLVWQSKTRVEAVSTETALRSDSFRSIGKVIVHSEHYAICVLGAGLEVHLMCPGDEPHCKECGAIDGKSPVFCRTCNPRPTAAVGDELKPRSEKLAANRLAPVSNRMETKRGGRSRKPRPARPVQDILIDLDF